MKTLNLGMVSSSPAKLAIVSVLLLVGLLFVPNSWGQGDRGSISGTVTDSTGAVIPNVKITLVQSATGVLFANAMTDRAGRYSFVNLPIGSYAMTFIAAGFREYNRNGITISVDQAATLNVALQVGAQTEVVTVTSDAELLDHDLATEATTMSASDIEELPLAIAGGGRNAMTFANMAVPTVGVGGLTPNYSVIVANSLGFSTNIMVDGVDADATMQGTQVPPGVDAVQQIQVQTSGIDAENSQTGGGSFQYELKSGTDQIHGSAFNIRTNEAIDTNTWSNNYFLAYCNAAGAGSSNNCPSNYQQNYRRPTDRHNDYGFSAGGPIWKKHTYIFGAYERYTQNTLAWNANGNTVPTTAELGGDFSALLTVPGIMNITNPVTGQPGCTALPCQAWNSSGNPVVDNAGNPVYWGQIFDATSDQGVVIPGNIIPSGKMSSVAQKIIAIYQKDYKPTNDNLIGNYWGFGGSLATNQNLDAKLDHYFSEKHHVSGSVNWAKDYNVQLGSHIGGSLWQQGTQDGGPLGSTQAAPQRYAVIHLTDNYTLKPNMINTAILAFNWYKKNDTVAAPVGDIFGLGTDLFPSITFSGGAIWSGQSAIGQNFDDYFRQQQIRLKDAVNWVHGRNTVKFGGEYISLGSLTNAPNAIVNYQFVGSTGAPKSVTNDSVASQFVGSGFASMLMGAPNGGSRPVTIGSHTIGHAMDFFGDDLIKVNNKLMVDLSLRWDFNFRLHELNGNWSNYNPDQQNSNWPGEAGAINYLSNGSQSFELNEAYHLFSPHVGVAYQLPHQFVLRGAWGMFYVPMGNNGWGGVPYYNTGGCFDCFGTNIVPPPPGSNVYNPPAFFWDQNLYPGVATPGAKNPNGDVGGWGNDTIDPHYLSLGHTQNWNAGFEWGLDKNTVLDVRYAGNVGQGLQDASLYPYNYPTWSEYQAFKSAGGNPGAWVTTQQGAEQAGVTWFPAMINCTGCWGGYNGYSAIPFGPPGAPQNVPQASSFWGGVYAVGFPHGNSGYNALIAEVKKRAGQGLTMDLSYTLSHAVQNVGNSINSWNGNQTANIPGNFAQNNGSIYQDPYSYGNFKGMISPNDIRHMVKGYVTYNLPVGKGGMWLNQNALLNYFVGGWTLSGDVNYHTGFPLGAVYSTNYYPGWSTVYANMADWQGQAFKNHFKHLDLANWADPSNEYFDPTVFSNPAQGAFGNQNPVLSNVRGWAMYDEDLGLIKRFGVGRNERFKASLRADFFDVFNRHTYDNPQGGNLTNTFLGYVTGVYGNRTGQFGGRFTW